MIKWQNINTAERKRLLHLMTTHRSEFEREYDRLSQAGLRMSVYYSRYPYLYLKTSKRGLVKGVHPENFSKTPVALAQPFYDVEHGPYFDPLRPFETMQKAHFVVSHTHIDQSGYSKDGVYEMHAIGTCRDPNRTQYKATSQNNHHQWSPSFLKMKRGYFTHLHVWGTNWEEELGELFFSSPFAAELFLQLEVYALRA